MRLSDDCNPAMQPDLLHVVLAALFDGVLESTLGLELVILVKQLQLAFITYRHKL
jgi:hypothetical protein